MEGEEKEEKNSTPSIRYGDLPVLQTIHTFTASKAKHTDGAPSWFPGALHEAESAALHFVVFVSSRSHPRSSNLLEKKRLG